MTLLDDRARRASESVHRSFAGYAPAQPLPAVVRRRTIRRAAGWSAASAAAVAVFVAVVLVVPTELEPESTGPVLPTTVPPTSVSVVPVEPPDGAPPGQDSLITTDTVPVIVGASESAVDEGTPELVPKDLTPPPLTIDSPKTGAHFIQQVVTFTGTTEPGATVVAGGKFEADVDGSGAWSISLVIFPGANGATFVATDAAGNESVAKIVVHLDEPESPPPAEEKPPPEKEEPPPEEPPPPAIEFTATQVYGSCSEDPPYDVFHGTAKPGTEVRVVSEYGAGATTANADGRWEVKVVFTSAPYGQTFLVSVKDHTGAKQSFEFTSYAGG